VDHRDKLTDAASPVDRDQHRVAAGLHQMLVRIGERRQQRQFPRIQRRRIGDTEIIKAVRVR
jgi:hypothetical protein